MLNIVISTFFKTLGMVAIAKFSWDWLFVSSGEYFFLEYISHNFTRGCLLVLLKFSKYILLKFWMNLSAYIFFRFEYLEKWLIVLLSFLSWSCARGAKIFISYPFPLPILLCLIFQFYTSLEYLHCLIAWTVQNLPNHGVSPTAKPRSYSCSSTLTYIIIIISRQPIILWNRGRRSTKVYPWTIRYVLF